MSPEILRTNIVTMPKKSVAPPHLQMSAEDASPTPWIPTVARARQTSMLPYEATVNANPSGGVARICCEEGQRLKKLCHGALTVTVDFGAGCSSCSMTNSFVTNAVLIERAVSC